MALDVLIRLPFRILSHPTPRYHALPDSLHHSILHLSRAHNPPPRMSSSTPSETEFHPVADRVLYVGNVPFDTTAAELTDCFDICLGKNSRTSSQSSHF